MPVEPIRPDEVSEAKKIQIPDAVFETFNELIAEKFSGNSAVIKQVEIMDRLKQKGYINRQLIFDSHWLDVEGIYQQAGWTVDYEKPGYNESGEAFFTFSKGKT